MEHTILEKYKDQNTKFGYIANHINDVREVLKKYSDDPVEGLILWMHDDPDQVIQVTNMMHDLVRASLKLVIFFQN